MTRVAVVALVCLAVAACATSARPSGVRSDTYDARKKLARELVQRQDWAAAFAYADQLHRDRPDDADVLVLRGIIYRERGLTGEAEADLNEAIRLDPQNSEAYAALGIVYDLTRRTREAEQAHRQAVRLVPDNVAYLNNLGFSLFLRRQYKEAIKYYREAARLSPTTRRLRTNLGFAYAGDGDFVHAAREFEMGGTPAEAKNNLGFAYERRGDMVNAYALYLEAARLDPKLARAWTNLVHAAEVLGKPLPEDVRLQVTAAQAQAPTSAGAGDPQPTGEVGVHPEIDPPTRKP